MASPKKVNEQITDSITQSNLKVTGEAAALAMGNLYQATAQALSMAAQNAVAAQQQLALVHEAATTAGIAKIRSSVAGLAPAVPTSPSIPFPS